MRRMIASLGVALLTVIPAHTEVKYNSVSATATSQTVYFPVSKTSFLICNFGTNEIYYRVFQEGDTPAAATTSYAQLVAGTATAPICKSFGWQEGVKRYTAVSIVCASAETATVQLESQ